MLLDQGLSQVQVARELGVTRAAVWNWANTRREHGEEGLLAKPHPGRGSKLNARQLQQLEKMLKRGPRKNGYSTELWTLSRIAELIERR